MKLRFVWVGKAKKRPIKELVAEYLGRLEKFVRVEVVEIRDQVGTDTQRIIEKEGEEIRARIESDPFVVVCDEGGKPMGSVELADFIERHRLTSTKQITFVIGGYGGLSKGVKKRADAVLSLSRMTLTHEFARVILVEQVYRAFTIIHDLPYQK